MVKSYRFKRTFVEKVALSIVFLTIMFSLETTATIQGGDVLMFEGERYGLNNYPLESYPEYDSLKEKYFNIGCSMGNIRGYVATWLVENNKLFLLKIVKCSEPKAYANLEKIFGERCVDGRVEASWYSGVLYAPYGKCLLADVRLYLVIHEKELSFNVNSGKVDEVEYLDNSATHISIYHDDNQAFLKYISDNINWDSIPDTGGETVRVYVGAQSGSDRKPDNVHLMRESGYDAIDREVVRVISSLPDWDVFYLHGKVKPIKMVYPIPIKK